MFHDPESSGDTPGHLIRLLGDFAAAHPVEFVSYRVSGDCARTDIRGKARRQPEERVWVCLRLQFETSGVDRLYFRSRRHAHLPAPHHAVKVPTHTYTALVLREALFPWSREEFGLHHGRAKLPLDLQTAMHRFPLRHSPKPIVATATSPGVHPNRDCGYKRSPPTDRTGKPFPVPHNRRAAVRQVVAPGQTRPNTPGRSLLEVPLLQSLNHSQPFAHHR